MKEKLIVFTRNGKNRIWMVIAQLIIYLSLMAVIAMGANVQFLILKSILLWSLAIVELLWYAVWQLFKVDEQKIRNNSLFLVLLATDEYVWFPIMTIISIIYAIIAAMLGLPVNFIIFLCMTILSIFLGNTIVAKYFSKKLK